MGLESSSGDSSSNSNDTEVILNVYDLTPVNNYVAWFGFGIFHSGIEGMKKILSFSCFCIYFYSVCCVMFAFSSYLGFFFGFLD